MKTFLPLLFAFTLYADVEISGHVDIDAQQYLSAPSQKNKNSFTAKETLELKYNEDAWTLYTKLYAQQDSSDFTSSDKKNERTFGRVDELYGQYDFDDDSVQFGKSIKFWGALELRNVVDGFNPQDFRTDMLDADKLGVWNLSYSHFTEDGELSLIVKLYEQDQEMAAAPYVYYFFPSFVNYNSKLNTQDTSTRPSIYLKYSASTDTEYPLDYSFIYENGYDSQRYYTADKPQNLSVTSPTYGYPTEFSANAYIVNKIMTYETLVVGATLIKLEALYVKVDEDKYMGDYSHIGLGVEHTVENIYDSTALGFLAEYYRYDTYESDKYGDLELFETMQNDVFVGLRYSLNNAEDSSFVGGVIADFEYGEQVYYLDFESHLADSYKLNLDYYYVEPSKSKATAYALLGRHQRVAVNIAYYF